MPRSQHRELMREEASGNGGRVDGAASGAASLLHLAGIEES